MATNLVGETTDELGAQQRTGATTFRAWAWGVIQRVVFQSAFVLRRSNSRPQKNVLGGVAPFTLRGCVYLFLLIPRASLAW